MQSLIKLAKSQNPESETQVARYRKVLTNQDMMRGSSTSEGGTGVRASVDGGLPDNTSIMPELPLSLPDNHYHIDSAAIYEVSGSTSQEQTPIAGRFHGARIFPDGPIEMPAENYDSDAENRGPEARHDYVLRSKRRSVSSIWELYSNNVRSGPHFSWTSVSLKIVNPEPESPDEVAHILPRHTQILQHQHLRVR